MRLAMLAACAAVAFVPVLARSESASCQGVEEVLARKLVGYAGKPTDTFLRDMTMNAVVERDLAADDAWMRLGSPAEIAAYRERLKSGMVAAVGGFPGRTPLNARTVATVKRDGYTIEKVLFESRPRHYVTALVFVPGSGAGAAVGGCGLSVAGGKHPGVLVTCGHDYDGKGSKGNQRACVVLAKSGFVTIIYDPIDQGERKQLPESDLRSVSGHVNAGLRAHLLGWGAAQFRIWDGIRALDLLASRPDVDATRLGVTGMSGGGTLSSYLNAVDWRYKAACPMGYLTTMRALGLRCGPQDSEQIIHGQLAIGLNHLSLMLMNGGSALCPGFTYGDFFPYFGSMESFRKACAFRAREGKGEMIDRFECAGPHGWYESEKQALALWFRRHLAGDAKAWPPDMEALRRIDIGFDYEKVDCGLAGTPEGDVLDGKGAMSVPGARSVYDIMKDELTRLEGVRGPLTREAVIKVAGMRAECAATVCAEREEALGGAKAKTAVLEMADGMRVPVTAFIPAAAKGEPMLIVGDATARKEYAGLVSGLLAAGRAVCVAELRGFGETRPSKRNTYWSSTGQETAAFLSWMGENLLARRAEDLLAASGWFAQIVGGAKVALHAEGGAVTAAAHAYFIARERFASFESVREPESWTELVRNPSLVPRFSDLVHGGLKVYDWKELLK